MVLDVQFIIDSETLLVLIGLTDGNPEIQKLVAFENAFEILFVIIEQEGGVDGGIVVQDCLQLLANLLRYNSSNQVLYLQIKLIIELFSRNERCSTSRWGTSFR
jgi:intracellular protein transport protein USO1